MELVCENDNDNSPRTRVHVCVPLRFWSGLITSRGKEKCAV